MQVHLQNSSAQVVYHSYQVKIKVRHDSALSPVLLPPTYADPVCGWSASIDL